jgi:hypothetical protein
MIPVVYRESTWPVAAAAVSLVVAGAGVVGLVVLRSGLSALALIAAILGLVGAGMFWGLARYSGVSISSTHLFVGRDRIELTRLDRAFGVRDSSALPPDVLARVSDMVGSMHVSPQRWREEIRADGAALLGGAYGIPIGYDVLVVREADGEGLLLAFASMRPERTAAALSAALAR